MNLAYNEVRCGGFKMSTAKIPLYKIIENDLLEKINTGYYKIDEFIPTELELSRKYSASRVTVRKATDSLVSLGLLSRTAGLGTVVKHCNATQKTTSQRSFSEDMKSLGMTCKTIVNTFTLKEADAQIASILGIEEKDMVYYIERSRYGNDEILMFEITHMAIKKFPDLSIQYLEKSKFDYIEKIKGLKIDFSFHNTIPMLANERIASMFKIDQSTPIIKVNNTTFLDNGDIMDFTEQYMNSPKYQLNYIRKR